MMCWLWSAASWAEGEDGGVGEPEGRVSEESLEEEEDGEENSGRSADSSIRGLTNHSLNSKCDLNTSGIRK